MPIPPVQSAKITAALEEFDRNHRGTETWNSWQANQNHRYAIEHDGQLYPVKEIVSLATGVPVSEFSGGVGTGQANQYVEDRGFVIAELKKRNPPWSRDELILALDLYLQHPDATPNQSSKEVTELSALLNQIGNLLHGSRYEKYRNPNGVYMKLMNFRRLDPHYAEAKGLPHGSKLDVEIWNEFSDDREACHQTAQRIRADIQILGKAPPTLDDDADHMGSITELRSYRSHRRIERDQSAGKKAKKALGYICQGCEFDFEAIYGPAGHTYIEAHHLTPLSELPKDKPVKLDPRKDFAVLCANCHRMMHRKDGPKTISELRAMSRVPALRQWLSNQR